MAKPPSDDVQAELRAAIARDRKVLGDVLPLLERGLSDPEIARELGRNTPGFVSNNRTHIRAILEGAVPRGATMARQTIGAVRRVASTPGLSTEARDHLRAVLADLDNVTAGQAPPEQRSTPAPQEASPTTSTHASLRRQVDDLVRVRLDELIQRIRDEMGLHADDYYRARTAGFALDEVARLVFYEATSRTTKALHTAGRLDLSVEQCVLDWVNDLPLTSDLVESASARLGWWKSQ